MHSVLSIEWNAGAASPKRRADEDPELTYKFPRKSPPGGFGDTVLTQAHLRLLREEKCCDVMFVAGQSKQKIPCHKSFLAARSPVFEAMFSERWSKRASQKIEIPDVDAKAFWMFLEFIYANIFEVNMLSEAIALLYVAQKYDVQQLVQQCENLVKTSMELEDAVAVFQAARHYWNENLMEFASDTLVTTKCLNAIYVRDDILKQMDKETLVYLLKQDDSEVKEADLFKVALQWGKNQLLLGAKDTLGEVLDDIIPLIRFPAMTLKEFTAVVVPSGLLKQHTLIKMYTYFGSDKKTQKELAKSLNFCIVTPRQAYREAVMSLYEETSEINETAAIICLKDKIGFKVNIHRNLRKEHFRFRKEPKEVAITSIILRCPEKRIHGNPGEFLPTADPHDLFKLSIVKSEFTLNDCDYSRNTDRGFDLYFQPNKYKDTVICPVKLEWGQEMEVKVEPPVTVENGRDYLITLQQVHERYKSYEYGYSTLGGLKPAVDVELDSNYVGMTHVRNSSSGVSVIYKIKYAAQ